MCITCHVTLVGKELGDQNSTQIQQLVTWSCSGDLMGVLGRFHLLHAGCSSARTPASEDVGGDLEAQS